MIESAGGMIPFLCHVFLIFFGGFFALNFVFNQNFAKNSFGYDSIEAVYMGRPFGFLMSGVILMLIATLFQIGGFSSANELISVIFIFTVISVWFNTSRYTNSSVVKRMQNHSLYYNKDCKIEKKKERSMVDRTIDPQGYSPIIMCLGAYKVE